MVEVAAEKEGEMEKVGCKECHDLAQRTSLA